MATTNSRPPVGSPRAQRPFALIHLEERRANVPAVLGLLGVASGTCTFSAVLAGWFPPGTMLVAAAIMIIGGGLVPFLATLGSYGRGDTFFGAVFGCVGSDSPTGCSRAAYVLL